MGTIHDERAPEFHLVRGGAIDRLTARLGMTASTPRKRIRKLALLMAVTWLPLLILSLVSGAAYGDRVDVPFLHDPEVQARFLITLPLLEFAEVMVAVSLMWQVQHLRELGVIPEEQLPRFDAACDQALAVRGSIWTESVILVVALLLAIAVRILFGYSEGDLSWERNMNHFTLAGWYHTVISTPILYFFLFRWLTIFLIWGRLLFEVSRLSLQLTPTHPDRSGGIGFLGWGLACFAPVLAAVSTVFSSAFAQEILHHGESLDSLKYHVGVFVFVVLLIMHLPLLFFTGRLSRCRFVGLLEFGALVWRYERAFEEKWLKPQDSAAEGAFLGSADIQSLADIATPYDHANEMRLIPFDSKSFAVLAIATLLPMLPLVGTEIPLHEIFAKLGELVI